MSTCARGYTLNDNTRHWPAAKPSLGVYPSMLASQLVPQRQHLSPTATVAAPHL